MTEPLEAARGERELFAAVTKTDLGLAIKHIRDWCCHIDDHHRQKYADLLEDQAKLIAWLIERRAAPARCDAESATPDGQSRFDEPANIAMVAAAAILFVAIAITVFWYLAKGLLQ